MSSIRIEQFDPERHDRSGFNCGVDRLNNFLKLSAKKQQKDDMTRIYVLLEEGSHDILGYHAINVGLMDVREMTKRPKGTPSHGEIPVLFLGQIAISTECQGYGLGHILMHHIFLKACTIADVAGCHAILLDVMSEGGEDAVNKRRSWYEAFGFQPFVSNPLRMFLPMSHVRASVQL